jgi:hypothetical protein
MYKATVIVPNHNRDISVLKEQIPEDVELIEVNLGFERSFQRNLGILQASAAYYLFLDSDQTISPKLIDECIELCENGADAVYIPEVIVAKSWFGKLRAWERNFYTGTAVDVPRFIRGSVCPKFSTELNGPEDSDWANRIKGKIVTSKNFLYHHDDIGFFEYCKKKAYYSKSMKRYEERNPGDKCTNLKYRCWTVFTENGKWKELIKRPLSTIGLMLLIITRGIIYYANR